MLAALATIEHHAKIDKEQFDNIVLTGPSLGHGFGHQPVEGYSHAAITGCGFLEALKDIVLRIDETNWPQNFKNPEVDG
jgi:hypothetical protein